MRCTNSSIAHHGRIVDAVNALKAKGGQTHHTAPTPDSAGYYLSPTLITGVAPEETLEEIFGPVLSIMPYDTVDQAVQIGNDTEYGLAAYVSGGDFEKVRAVASRLRAGQVALNGAGPDMLAPFGGYKQSGNGREWGDHAFGEFLETKAIMGMPKLEAAE